MEQSSLVCSLVIEELGSAGDVKKRIQHKQVELVLGRDEFRDMVLKVQMAGGKKTQNFLLREVDIHKKFAKDGKASLKFADKKLQLFLSNCPPHQLVMFLRTISTKFTCLKDSGFVAERVRMLSDKQRSFDEISPSTVKDVKALQEIRAKNEEKRPDMFTPKAANKRKRIVADGKENPKSLGTSETTPSKPVQKKAKSYSPLSSTQLRKPISLNSSLNAEQKKVMQAVKQGQNVFFTGSAGTGKSFLLKRLIGALPPQHTFATASTGVAACHIGGTTLHSFAGIGSGVAPIERCIELASRSAVAQQWRKCKHLIIDEISMIDGAFFDKLELVARIIKKSDKPFGGIQLVLCGDFFQLPPVTKGSDAKKNYAFQSRAWRNCIDNYYELKEVKRQSDRHFIDVLQQVRIGNCTEVVLKTLQNTAHNQIGGEGIIATRLCTHKEDVDLINNRKLEKLSGNSRMFEASDSDPMMVSTTDALCPVKQKLELKIGTQVMLTKNQDVQQGLVNGARGVVVEFSSEKEGFYPVVKFLCGVTTVVQPEKFIFKVTGGLFLSRRQLPLKLAWAISIHKSQGMTLDCVEISLAKVFESGQAYVALSRAKSLEGLRILDFHKFCVRCDPVIIEFYRKMSLCSTLRQASRTMYPLGGGKHLKPM